MLSDTQTIDMVIPISSDALMLVVSDMHPWPDPDSSVRFGQYLEKLQAYSRYVGDDSFESNHRGVPPTKVVVSIVSLVPVSARMRQIRVIECKKHGSNILITISYADEENASGDLELASQTSAQHSTVLAAARRRLLIRGWIVAGIGAIPMFATQIASLLEFDNQLPETIMSICFWGGALILVVGFGMVLWSQQDW
jgi:hypothetical protein